MSKIVLLDHTGAQQEATLDASIYAEAAAAKVSVPQLLARKYPTDSQKFGSTFHQLMASTGFAFGEDKEHGFKKATLADVLGDATTATRDSIPTSRILFPAAILELINDKLYEDKSADVAAFESMIAIDETLNGPRYEQPVINFDKPLEGRMMPQSQLSEPTVMGTLTVSEKAGRLPTFSLGLTVSDEALQASTIDFVGLSLAKQAEEQKAVLAEAYIMAFLNGDVDMGQAALAKVKANTYDSALTVSGTLSHRAAIKWLRTNRRKRNIDFLMGNTDAYLAWVGRSGRPTVNNVFVDNNELMAKATVAINGEIAEPKFYINDALPANTIIGLDSRYAIRRIRNSAAEYQAAEAMVMRRGQALRWDMSEICHRLFDDAWTVLDLTV